jgi:hypothetical protein
VYPQFEHFQLGIQSPPLRAEVREQMPEDGQKGFGTPFLPLA